MSANVDTLLMQRTKAVRTEEDKKWFNADGFVSMYGLICGNIDAYINVEKGIRLTHSLEGAVYDVTLWDKARNETAYFLLEPSVPEARKTMKRLFKQFREIAIALAEGSGVSAEALWARAHMLQARVDRDCSLLIARKGEK